MCLAEESSNDGITLVQVQSLVSANWSVMEANRDPKGILGLVDYQ